MESPMTATPVTFLPNPRGRHGAGGRFWILGPAGPLDAAYRSGEPVTIEASDASPRFIGDRVRLGATEFIGRGTSRPVGIEHTGLICAGPDPATGEEVAFYAVDLDKLDANLAPALHAARQAELARLAAR